jgi:hypothetical protein
VEGMTTARIARAHEKADERTCFHVRTGSVRQVLALTVVTNRSIDI